MSYTIGVVLLNYWCDNLNELLADKKSLLYKVTGIAVS